MSISLKELRLVIATEFLSLSLLIKHTYLIQLVQISSNGSFSLMKSPHCFLKMSLGTYTIVQKIVSSLTNDLLVFLGKNESICRGKKVKNIIFIFQRVENSVVKKEMFVWKRVSKYTRFQKNSVHFLMLNISKIS